MRELSVKCRNNNLVLSVDVPSPYSFNEHYSQKELGEVVDYVIIMGYDEHYVGSDAGSVASLSYERDGITGKRSERKDHQRYSVLHEIMEDQCFR